MQPANSKDPSRGFSKTALGVALLRAAHQTLDGAPKILRDPIVTLLLDDDWPRQIGTQPGWFDAALTDGLRSHVVLRSRYTEERLARAVQRGVNQCVILGAGFDTFAYRQPGWAADIRIFEVDHPATQDEKRFRLQRAGIPIPSNLEFVSIDFESVSLRDGLLYGSSLDFERPAFFSCLGVLMYLTQDAVDAVFRLVAGFPPGSEITFTFAKPDPVLKPLEDEVRLIGEPWRTYFDPATLAHDLQDFGFSEVSILNPKAAEANYFQNRSDNLHAPRLTTIATAVVGGPTL